MTRRIQLPLSVLLLLLLNFEAELVAGEFSWCDPQLCNEGTRHVACNNTGVSS